MVYIPGYCDHSDVDAFWIDFAVKFGDATKGDAEKSDGSHESSEMIALKEFNLKGSGV